MLCFELIFVLCHCTKGDSWKLGGSFSNYGGDGNKNDKKVIGLIRLAKQ